MFYTLVKLFSYTDAQEQLNDLPTKLQGLDNYCPSSIDFIRTTTPSSRDSGIPIRSTSTSSCTSPSIETKHTSKSSPGRVLEFFLHPPARHLNYSVKRPMSSIYDLTSHPHHSSSPRRSVHWNEQSMISSKEEIDHLNSHGKKSGRHILLNASLPFYSKLNIRIRTCRDENNENDHVTATAKIERIDPRHDHKHIDSLRNAPFHHYSTLSSNESRRTDSSILDKRLPTHHQVSLPADLPINQQLVLYINNGEVYARC